MSDQDQKRTPENTQANENAGDSKQAQKGAVDREAAAEMKAAAEKSAAELDRLKMSLREIRSMLDKEVADLTREVHQLRHGVHIVQKTAEPQALDTLVARHVEQQVIAIEEARATREADARKRLEALLEAIEEESEALSLALRKHRPADRSVLQERCKKLEARIEASEAECSELRRRRAEGDERVLLLEGQLRRLEQEDGRELLDNVLQREQKLREREQELKELDSLRTENQHLMANMAELRHKVEQFQAQDRKRVEVVGLHSEVDRLSERLREAHRECERNRNTRAACERELTVARTELRALQADMETQQARLQAEIDRESLLEKVRERFKELHASHERVKEEKERLVLDLDHAEQECEKAREREMQAMKLARQQVQHENRDRVENFERNLQQRAEALRDQEFDGLRAELCQLKLERQRDTEALTHLSEQKRALEDELQETKLLENQLRREVDEELLTYRREQQGEILKKSKDLITRNAELEEHLADLEARQTHRQVAVQELEATQEALRQEVHVLRAEHSHHELQRDALKREIETLRRQEEELRHIDLPLDERLAALRKPELERGQLLDTREAPSEEQWLESISQSIAGAGFQFSDRLIKAFHTSLKSASMSPITVLSGISGTGKSQLPRLYADHGGLHFLHLAVQPHWDSPDDLFGFFNYTDGRYRATPLSRVLHQVAGLKPGESDSLHDQVLLVLLDEMNIARVEYYFAELLSRLETRRGLTRDDPRAHRASILIDAGAGHNPERLFLDHNVLFVGTMNEDESTLTLSDKVRDRANVLHFPRPNRFAKGGAGDGAGKQEHKLSRETWESWQRPLEDCGAKVEKRVRTLFREFNEALDHVGRAVGHRVFQSVLSYVANYPGSINGGEALEHSIADAFSFKLAPKLNGIETRSERGERCLASLESAIPVEVQEAFGIARSQDWFAWQGSQGLFRVEAPEERLSASTDASGTP